MIGRGIFHNPWLFNPQQGETTPQQKLQLLWDHTHLFHQTWGPNKNFNQLRRFYKIYVSNFAEAGELRSKLMQVKNISEVKATLQDRPENINFGDFS